MHSEHEQVSLTLANGVVVNIETINFESLKLPENFRPVIEQILFTSSKFNSLSVLQIKQIITKLIPDIAPAAKPESCVATQLLLKISYYIVSLKYELCPPLDKVLLLESILTLYAASVTKEIQAEPYYDLIANIINRLIADITSGLDLKSRDTPRILINLSTILKNASALEPKKIKITTDAATVCIREACCYSWSHFKALHDSRLDFISGIITHNLDMIINKICNDADTIRALYILGFKDHILKNLSMILSEISKSKDTEKFLSVSECNTLKSMCVGPLGVVPEKYDRIIDKYTDFPQRKISTPVIVAFG